MPDHDELKKVPTPNVGEVAQAYADDDYTEIICTQQSDQTWTIRASK